MKFTVADIKFTKRMVKSSNEDDLKNESKSLHKKQPYLCNMIDELKYDSRCYEAHRFSILFCSLSLEQAELMVEEALPAFSLDVLHDMSYKILSNKNELGKRERSYPDRINKHVLNSMDFDNDDNSWLQMIISTFLILIEKYMKKMYSF